MRSTEPVIHEVSSCRQLYQEMQLDGVVNFEAFEQAITGYHKIEDKTKEILTLVDFSKPSTEERFYVFDMRHKNYYSLRWYHTERIAEGIMPPPFPTRTVPSKVHWGSS